MSKIFQKLILSIYRRFDYEEIGGMRDSVRSHSVSRERSIRKELDSLNAGQFESDDDYEDYIAHLEADTEFLGAVEELADELCVLALHKKLEITIAKLLKKFYPTLKANELHRIDYLKGNLAFDVESLQGYSSANELRLINNAIKHQGLVSKPLSAQYPSWVEGAPLSGLGAAFLRLGPGIETYVAAFCSAIEIDLAL
jgi:hypothetical protein